MADLNAIRSGEDKLRRRLSSALREEKSLSGIAFELIQWQLKGWGPILFGGFLRDLMVFGLKKWPRDIDIVFLSQTTEQLERDFLEANPRKNRFGGIHCELKKWQCDMWPLETTWGFHQKKRIEPTPANLTKTTFLNVEAVAAEFGPGGTVTAIHHNGFFEAMRSKVLDINLEDNPFPPLAAVRALLTARKLNFAVAPRLSEYVLRTAEKDGLSSFIEFQISHYGEVRLSEPQLSTMLRELESAFLSNQALYLGPKEARQLKFWSEDRLRSTVL